MILSIETSTFFCSVALHNQGKLLAEVQLQVPQATASQLSVMVNQVCVLTGIKPGQLEAIAVSSGPGSYTGLRIGVATAKGLCFGLGIPLIAVGSLPLLVQQVMPFNSNQHWLCPMLDARRMEVYTQLFNASGQAQSEVHALVVDESSYKETLDRQPILFFGNGAGKCRNTIRHPHAIFLSDVQPSAGKLGELAFQKFVLRAFEDVASFEPFYLKEFIAKKPKTDHVC